MAISEKASHCRLLAGQRRIANLWLPSAHNSIACHAPRPSCLSMDHYCTCSVDDGSPYSSKMRECMPGIAPRVALLLLLLTYGSAHARLGEAETDYQKGDYPKAFKEFKELAELGQPIAQYDLAIMYESGRGTDSSNTWAHAWASLSALNGEEDAKKLVAKLEPLLTPTSLRLSAELQHKFSQSALDARLLPKIIDREFQT